MRMPPVVRCSSDNVTEPLRVARRAGGKMNPVIHKKFHTTAHPLPILVAADTFTRRLQAIPGTTLARSDGGRASLRPVRA